MCQYIYLHSKFKNNIGLLQCNKSVIVVVLLSCHYGSFMAVCFDKLTIDSQTF